LWVVSIDDSGNVLWDVALAVDGDELIGTLQLRQRDCSTLGPDDHGHLAFAISAHGGESIVRGGNRIVVGPEVRTSERRRVLVFKFDVYGREVARTRVADGNVPRLSRTEQGYVLVDSSLLASNRGVRQTVLDRDLKVLSQRIIGNAQSYLALEAALAADKGGFHLAGYRIHPPEGRGRAAFAYLSASGEILGEKTFGLRLPSWVPVAVVEGERRGELILLQRGEDDDDIRLMRLRYSE
jgi:hypothetical protein